MLAAGTIAITVTTPGPEPIAVDLRIDGTHVMDRAAIQPGQHRVALVPAGDPALAFVEVEAVRPDGQAAAADVVVQR